MCSGVAGVYEVVDQVVGQAVGDRRELLDPAGAEPWEQHAPGPRVHGWVGGDGRGDQHDRRLRVQLTPRCDDRDVTRREAVHVVRDGGEVVVARGKPRSAEHTSELQSLMRISYAVFCLKK